MILRFKFFDLRPFLVFRRLFPPTSPRCSSLLDVLVERGTRCKVLVTSGALSSAKSQHKESTQSLTFYTGLVMKVTRNRPALVLRVYHLTFVHSTIKSKSQSEPGLSTQTKSKHNKLCGEIPNCQNGWLPAGREGLRRFGGRMQNSFTALK